MSDSRLDDIKDTIEQTQQVVADNALEVEKDIGFVKQLGGKAKQ